jgi:hypothetical protein
VCDDGDGGTNIDVCTSGVCAGTHQAVCNKGADITGISFMDPEDGLLKASTSGDGVVNIEDILGILSQYRREGCGNFADVTGPSGVADCVVGIHDLLYVLANFRCKVSDEAGGACEGFNMAAAAETTCKDATSCSACHDFNFGDDCASNSREHCAEIDCCAVCETEIRAMWVCEHGSVCGEGLTCEPDCEMSLNCGGQEFTECGSSCTPQCGVHSHRR